MKALKLLTATLLAIGAAQAYADQTNLVQNVSIQLFGVRQGRTVTNGNLVSTGVDVVRLDTRRVIQVLGEATGNTFSQMSRLVMVTPLNGDSAIFQVRDGDRKVDVTRYLVYEQLSDSVQSLQLNLRTGRSLGVAYSIQRLALQDDGGVVLSSHFDVNGFARQVDWNGRTGDDVSIEVSGVGDREGLLILQGSIGIFGHQIEVVPGDPTGPPIVT